MKSNTLPILILCEIAFMICMAIVGDISKTLLNIFFTLSILTPYVVLVLCIIEKKTKKKSIISH
jgi:hypothetical protein